ncbi:MAG TPA: hypothetical protein VJV23_17205 [Candidatus Polarisedimenticolia bacterium]|nr:hypothetical protein [Candidatus Polarisedimenticolia bacterium]
MGRGQQRPAEGAAGAGSGAPRPGPGEQERLGPGGTDYLILGVAAPGFEELDRPQRVLAWWLYRAAIAGDRITTDQCHRHALEIQELMEAIHLSSRGLLPRTREAVHDHLKHLWINHGQYSADDHAKFVPRLLTPSMLRQAAVHAASRGAAIELLPGEDLDAKLRRLHPHIFDPDVEPVQTDQGEGVDHVAASAVNLYDRGITSAMIDALRPDWKERLNVRFALEDGRAVPHVYQVGGRYGRDLETVVHFLERALPWCESDDQRAGLAALIEHFRTGEEEPFRRHSIHWLRSATVVDYLNGFIEQYDDPRGVIGQYEANVSFAADSRLIARLAGEAAYFEARMPWDDRWKRAAPERPVASVVNVVVETGDAGPCSPAAYNLPNDAALRRDHGSKNVVLHNIENARSPAVQEALRETFYLPRFRDLVRRHEDTGRRWIVFMHEVIGHGSGQPEPGLPADPRALIGAPYSSLEECRADLVALHHIADGRLAEIGAFPRSDQEEIVAAAYIGYLQGHVARYRTFADDVVREAHRRGAELILQYLLRGGFPGGRDFGVRLVQDRGDVYVDLVDPAKARGGVGELLGRLQSIKSRGDRREAGVLFEQLGTRVDPAVRRNVRARADRLAIPRLTAFVFPRLEPVVRGGEVVDASLVHDEDLTAQQLRFRRLRFDRAIG